jgi:hypothetical protein
MGLSLAGLFDQIGELWFSIANGDSRIHGKRVVVRIAKNKAKYNPSRCVNEAAGRGHPRCVFSVSQLKNR